MLGPRYCFYVSSHDSKLEEFDEKPYARHVSMFPHNANPGENERLQIYHGDNSIEKESHEMRKRKVRNTIPRPRTVMVHSRDTSCRLLVEHAPLGHSNNGHTVDRFCNDALAVA